MLPIPVEFLEFSVKPLSSSIALLHLRVEHSREAGPLRYVDRLSEFIPQFRDACRHFHKSHDFLEGDHLSKTTLQVKPVGSSPCRPAAGRPPKQMMQPSDSASPMATTPPTKAAEVTDGRTFGRLVAAQDSNTVPWLRNAGGDLSTRIANGSLALSPAVILSNPISPMP